jgi:hypothetical protein
VGRLVGLRVVELLVAVLGGFPLGRRIVIGGPQRRRRHWGWRRCRRIPASICSLHPAGRWVTLIPPAVGARRPPARARVAHARLPITAAPPSDAAHLSARRPATLVRGYRGSTGVHSMESDHHYPAILAIQRPPPTLAVRSNDGSAGHPETALQIGIPEGVGGVKGCCGWWCCWGACVWARAGGGAGV